MKALKLSTLAACLFLLVSSCTRDTDSLSSASSSSLSSVLGSSKTTGAEDKGKVPAGTPATTEDEEDPNGLRPEMTITYSDEPATVNQPMTITASFVTTTVAAPQCGKLVLEQLADDPATPEIEWVAVEDEAGNVVESLISPSNQTLVYTFTPTVVGDPAYTFRAQYKFNIGGQGGKCAGYKNSHSDGFPLEVKEACDVTTLTVTPSVVAEDLKDGNYKFTITYILKNPEALENIHFQGGATSGGKFEHKLLKDELEGLQVLHDNNQNTVLFWEGSLKPCEPVTLSFSYIRKFSCPGDALSEVTGGWSVTGGGLLEPKVVAPVVFDCKNVIRN